MTTGVPHSFLVTFTESPTIYFTEDDGPINIRLGEILIENLGFPPWFMLPNLLVHRPTRSLAGLTFDVAPDCREVARRSCEILNSPAIRFNGPPRPYGPGVYLRYDSARRESVPFDTYRAEHPTATEWSTVHVLWGADDPDEYMEASINEADSYFTLSEEPTPFDMNPDNVAGGWFDRDYPHLRWCAQGLHRVQCVLDDFPVRLPDRYRFPVEWLGPEDILPEWPPTTGKPPGGKWMSPPPKYR
jgi:hypothetical protein